MAEPEEIAQDAAEPLQDDPRPVFEGDWASASPAERGRHGARVQAWQRRQAAAGRAVDGQGSGSTTEAEERDRALALREARRLLRHDKTPDAVKAQLIRTLAGIDDGPAREKPPALAALDALSAEELEALVMAHL